MPTFIPLREIWGYLTGLFLLASGAALIADLKARLLTILLGIVLMLLVVWLNFPILAAAGPKGLVEALNYIGDTTLFAGTIFLVAGSLAPADSKAKKSPR